MKKTKKQKTKNKKQKTKNKKQKTKNKKTINIIHFILNHQKSDYNFQGMS